MIELAVDYPVKSDKVKMKEQVSKLSGISRGNKDDNKDNDINEGKTDDISKKLFGDSRQQP